MKITEKHGPAAIELYENWHSDTVLDGPDGEITVWDLLELVESGATSLRGCTVDGDRVIGTDGTILFEEA